MTTDKKRRCLLITHGQMTGGAVEKFCGFTDPPLSLDGKKSILNLRDNLNKQGTKFPNVWYVSDRRRAIETFEIMTAGLYAPVVRLTDKLREINFGSYENLTWDELPEDFQKHYEKCRHHPFKLAFPSGETFYEFFDRVTSGALEILSYGEDELGIIGHLGSLKMWSMIAEGEDITQFFESPLTHGHAFWINISAAEIAEWRHKFLGPPGKPTNQM